MCHLLLFINMSKIDFESKSQRCIVTGQNTQGCLSICQRQILKANHNRLESVLVEFGLFINMSKIDFESKSQLFRVQGQIPSCCLSICQRQILKANHNSKSIAVEVVVLFINMSKIDFESKSQHLEHNDKTNFVVYQYVKDRF